MGKMNHHEPPNVPHLRCTTFEQLGERQVRRWVWEPAEQRWTDRGVFDPVEATAKARAMLRPITEEETRRINEHAATLDLPR